MYDALFLLYYSWMNKKDQAIHRDDKDLILNKAAVLKKPKSQSFLFKSKLRRKDSLKKEKLVNLESTKKFSFKNIKLC